MSVLSEQETIFGRIVTGADVESWCLETLREWSSSYLAEVERQHGLTAGSLQRVRAWVTTPSFDKWPEDQLPAVLLISVGLAEEPLKLGSGSYRARWQMGIGCVVSARTEAETHTLAQLFIAAHRTLLVQRPSLGGRAVGITWQDEDYAQLPYDDVRSLGAGQATFTVLVEDVTTANAGPLRPDVPLSPDTDPWPLDPEAITVDVTVDHHPPPEPLPQPEP